MATIVVTLRIMPKDPTISLDEIRDQATKEVTLFGGNVGKCVYEPVAFGLKAVKLFFLMPEELGGTEKLENAIATNVFGVESVHTEDVRRTIG